MKKKVFGLAIAAVVIGAIVVLCFFYPWMDSPFKKERDLPVLYRNIAEYLTENWLIEGGLIQQTEGEVALFDFYKVDLSKEQREEIFQYLDKKYPPVNFDEPVQTKRDGYAIGMYPVFEISNLYWKEESGWCDMKVRCTLHSSTISTEIKLSYLFGHGSWEFLGESKVNYEDIEWYDQHKSDEVDFS